MLSVKLTLNLAFPHRRSCRFPRVSCEQCDWYRLGGFTARHLGPTLTRVDPEPHTDID